MYEIVKYNPIFVSQRILAVQDTYAAKKHLEGVSSAIAVFGREGIIEAVNSQFRDLTGITEGEIQNSTANIFDYLQKENTKFAEYIRIAFNGKRTVCRGVGDYVTVKEEKKETYQPERHQFAIFCPMNRAPDEIKLAAILLNENEPDDI